MKKTGLTILLALASTFCGAQSISSTDSINAGKTVDNPTAQKQNSQGGFAAYPARIFFNQDKGESGNKKLTLVNYTSDTLQLKVYLNDWERDTVGGHKYAEPGMMKRSCARWITLEKTFAELLPHQKQEMQIKMEVPDSADAVKEMKWAMLFVETKKETKLQKRGNLTLNGKTRIGIHLYQNPPNLTRTEVKIVNFSALPGEPKKQYRVVCQNVGDKQCEAKTHLELTPMSENGEKMIVANDNFPLFPGQVRYIDFKIPDTVPKGKYNAVAIIEPGGDAPVEAAQAIIEIK